jgi:predicted helicase
MTRPLYITPSHALIRRYYQELQRYTARHVEHESALRTAFQGLLTGSGRLHGWNFVPEEALRVGDRLVRPDGTLWDRNNLPRGYWEAKDPRDELNAEILRKIRRGYPLTNTIFENTRRAVLYQNEQPIARFSLGDPQELANLLNLFFAHTEPDIRRFEEAVDTFESRIPMLAKGLLEKIAEAHGSNSRFKQAFTTFFDLCRSSLNPNLRSEAVDEMLVQHLLTERLIRNIFDNPEFTRRNAIAVEVERVIDALVSESFSRSEYLKGLDPFYLAIEAAAHTLPGFTEKQHFLNSVYERFFRGFSVRVADTHGIIYTPQPIVEFICASVEEVLRSEFGKKLSDPDVHILDPCTGTGSFLIRLMHAHIDRRDLPRMYREQLFANEVMLMPYYIAALNIEHTYTELMGPYAPFPGLCFVDTLDIPEKGQLAMFTQENTERVDRERHAPITVILGNPPYNVGQINENDNNKNRKYPVIDGRVSETYARSSIASSTSKLNDPYVKFLRWATDRLADRDGIVCFVSNNSFLEQIAFDGMRRHLAQDFQRIYHLNLQGNVRKNPKLSGTAYNVFGIQVGVGITIAVRRAGLPRGISYHAVPLDQRRYQKLDWLRQQRDLRSVPWQQLTPDARHTWLVPEHAAEFARFVPMGRKKGKGADGLPGEAIFEVYSLGVVTNRDDWMFDFSRDALAEKVERFIETYNGEVDRWKRRKNRDAKVDDFVTCDDRRIKWSRDLKRDLKGERYAEFSDAKIRDALYRPFARRLLFLDPICNQDIFRLPEIFPGRQPNPAICIPGLGNRKPFGCLVTSAIPALDLAFEKAQCFPLYTYSPDGSHRRDNITDWALARFREHYRNPRITKLQIFHYVYALLHHPDYRVRFADNLKRDLPRIPFAPDFPAFAEAGERLAHLHLDYEQLPPHPLEFVVNPGLSLSYRVEDKMRLSKDKRFLVVNPSLSLAGIPPEAFNYRLGNRSALEWVIDQYQVTEDPRSGIRLDPNRPDDPEYIVRLLAQVIRVSLETLEILRTLAAWR